MAQLIRIGSELIGYTVKTTLRTGKNGVGPRKPLTHCGILMIQVSWSLRMDCHLG